MTVKAPNIVCPHCSAQNSPGRDICFKCRESLGVNDVSSLPLPSVIGNGAVPAWAATIWHIVTAPGFAVTPDGSRLHDIIVREVGRDSLVFDSDSCYQPSEEVQLAFMLEDKAVRIEGTVRRTARTLGTELAFATTLDLMEPTPEYIAAVTGINCVDDKEWWD